MAMLAYVALAVLALTTLTDSRIRGLTLIVLAMFAFKSWVRRKDVLHPDGEGEASDQVLAEGGSPRADGGFEPM